MAARAVHELMSSTLIPPSTSSRRRLRAAAWAGFLALCFYLTHTPPPAAHAPGVFNDKLLHLSGFTVLGWLTLWRLGPRDRRSPALEAALWFLALASYAMVDELTQPLVGRTAELSDWIADLTGGALGMLAVLIPRLSATTSRKWPHRFV